MAASVSTDEPPDRVAEGPAGQTARFTKESMECLVAALPGCTDPHRRELLPLLLQDWGATDLDDHLSRATPGQIQHEKAQLEGIAKQARELADALSRIDPDCRFAIAKQLMPPISNQGFSWPRFNRLHRMDQRLISCPTALGQLSASAEAVAKSWNPVTRRHETLVRFLVLEDLAQIFEWATGERAARRVRTDDSPEAGREYGPFWEFARASWTVIFGSERGLSHAVRKWSKSRLEYDVTSPLIANMNLRHPQWRICEP